MRSSKHFLSNYLHENKIQFLVIKLKCRLFYAQVLLLQDKMKVEKWAVLTMCVLSESAWGEPRESLCSATYRMLGLSLEAMTGRDAQELHWLDRRRPRTAEAKFADCK